MVVEQKGTLAATEEEKHLRTLSRAWAPRAECGRRPVSVAGSACRL